MSALLNLHQKATLTIGDDLLFEGYVISVEVAQEHVESGIMPAGMPTIYQVGTPRYTVTFEATMPPAAMVAAPEGPLKWLDEQIAKMRQRV